MNAFAPEHLELHVADAAALVPRVRNAGAIFVGPHAATAFGDYAAGTNHVLPTGGSARFGQGLSVSDFVKRVGGRRARRRRAAAAWPARRDDRRRERASRPRPLGAPASRTTVVNARGRPGAGLRPRSSGVTAWPAAIAAAGLVCFPTDTVYGIGGVVAPATAAGDLRASRDAAPDKPLQVVYPTLELLLAGVALSPAVADAARRLLPGPFTLVVPYPDGIELPARGRVEWPAAEGPGGAAPDDRADAGRARAGLAAGGARRWPRCRSRCSPRRPTRAAAHDPADLAGVGPAVRAACDLLLDAGPTSGVSSTVVDLSGLQAGRGFRVLRAGAVGAAEIAALLASQEGPAAP